MAAVQMGRGHMGDEELGTVGAGARVRHGKNAGAVMPEVRAALVLKPVARAPHACTGGVAALNHEIRNHAVKLEPVIKPPRRQIQKGSRRHGRLGSKHRQPDVALGSMDGDILVSCHGCMLNAQKGMVKAYCVQSPGPSVISRPFLRRTFPCREKEYCRTCLS